MNAILETARALILSLAVFLGLAAAPTPTVITPSSQPQLAVATQTPLAAKIITAAPQTPKTTTAPKTVKPQTVVATSTKVTGEEQEPVKLVRKISSEEQRRAKPLDPLEIFALTNIERASFGLKPVNWSEKLAASATAKAKDMIAKQYFAHESPDGTNVDDLAKRFNYNYSLVGENLAMGDFLSSADVVKGWMNSPGHRANILKPTYTEMGISAIIGLGDGRNMWYSVQEFGRPAPECEKPSAALGASITSGEERIKSITAQLSSMKAEIETSAFNSQESETRIATYNGLAELHNKLLNTIKESVEAFNAQVKTYNSCIESENTILEVRH